MNGNEDPACRQCAGADEPQQTEATGERHSLRCCVRIALQGYFAQLDGQMVSGVYEMVLAEIEAPMLETVLEYTRGNQTLAAEVLGLNRGTLRKKLKRYDML
ncbi:MAG TPA: DNA-binding transcriptional regulator Fis [Pseudomonadales bacterium]|nr:DNA-binding transcriptional regulator Fis [Pseudomonadales bacterium]